MSKPDFAGAWYLATQESMPAFLEEVGCPWVKVMLIKGFIEMGLMKEDCVVEPIDPKTGAFTFNVVNKMSSSRLSVVPGKGPQLVPNTPVGDIMVSAEWTPCRAGKSGRPTVGGIALESHFTYNGKDICFARHMEIDHRTSQELMVNEYSVNGKYLASKTYMRANAGS